MNPFEIPTVRGHLGAKNDRLLFEPLNPRLIMNLGLDNPIPKGNDFDPFGSWSLIYRIWGNHGWTRHQNKHMGHLEISRHPKKDAVHFEVRQVIVNTDGMFQVIEAELICAPDALSSLQSWSATMVCYDTAQCPMPGLNLNTRGQVHADQLSLTVNGQQRNLKLADPFLVSQWTIFDVLHRGNDAFEKSFTVLEHDRKCKPGHRLVTSTALDPQRIKAGRLDPVIQLGHGMLPWEYWRDSHQRVLYAFSGSVMMALDDKAPQETDKLIEELVQGGHHYEY